MHVGSCGIGWGGRSALPAGAAPTPDDSGVFSPDRAGGLGVEVPPAPILAEAGPALKQAFSSAAGEGSTAALLPSPSSAGATNGESCAATALSPSPTALAHASCSRQASAAASSCAAGGLPGTAFSGSFRPSSSAQNTDERTPSVPRRCDAMACMRTGRVAPARSPCPTAMPCPLVNGSLRPICGFAAILTCSPPAANVTAPTAVPRSASGRCRPAWTLPTAPP